MIPCLSALPLLLTLLTSVCVITQIRKPLSNLWLRTSDDLKAFETSFVVLGPIPKDNDHHGHITTGVSNMTIMIIIIGASRSEPHTSVVNRDFLYIYICVVRTYVRSTVYTTF